MVGDKDLESIPEENDLQVQIEGLKRQLRDQQTNTLAIWELLVALGSQLQLSLTSIKMSVSSLLDYEIFWDPSSAHEFLQVIDISTDRTANLVVLLTLAFRSQAKNLEISTEPHTLQEVLESLKSGVSKGNFEERLIVGYPPIGKPASVDYQYLIVGLRLLFEVAMDEIKGLEQLTFQAIESLENWLLRIGEMNILTADIIRQFFKAQNDVVAYKGLLQPENTLKLLVACRVLSLQGITLIEEPEEKATSITLSIPFASSSE